jgi:hypothetical protein
VSRLRPHRALLASSQWRIGNISTGYEIQQRPYWLGKPAQLFGRERIENIAQKRAELVRQHHNLLRGPVTLTVPRGYLRYCLGRSGPWKQRACCCSTIPEVSDWYGAGGDGLERPGPRGGMECSPARRATEPLAPTTTLARSEQAFAPKARGTFAHPVSSIRAAGTRWHACLIIVRDAHNEKICDAVEKYTMLWCACHRVPMGLI